MVASWSRRSSWLRENDFQLRDVGSDMDKESHARDLKDLREGVMGSRRTDLQGYKIPRRSLELTRFLTPGGQSTTLSQSLAGNWLVQSPGMWEPRKAT